MANSLPLFVDITGWKLTDALGVVTLGSALIGAPEDLVSATSVSTVLVKEIGSWRLPVIVLLLLEILAEVFPVADFMFGSRAIFLFVTLFSFVFLSVMIVEAGPFFVSPARGEVGLFPGTELTFSSNQMTALKGKYSLSRAEDTGDADVTVIKELLFSPTFSSFTLTRSQVRRSRSVVRYLLHRAMRSRCLKVIESESYQRRKKTMKWLCLTAVELFCTDCCGDGQMY